MLTGWDKSNSHRWKLWGLAEVVQLRSAIFLTTAAFCNLALNVTITSSPLFKTIYLIFVICITHSGGAFTFSLTSASITPSYCVGGGFEGWGRVNYLPPSRVIRSWLFLIILPGWQTPSRNHFQALLTAQTLFWDSGQVGLGPNPVHFPFSFPITSLWF